MRTFPTLWLFTAMTAAQAPQSTPPQEPQAARTAALQKLLALADQATVVVADTESARLLQSALDALEVQRRAALHNLANVGTAGFKRQRTTSYTTSTGSMETHTASEFTSGAVELTGRQLDVAIDGEGMFAVTLVDGRIGYMRNGRLQVDVTRHLTDDAGRRLLPAVPIPEDVLELAIDPEGRVTARRASNPDTATLLGTILLHRFLAADQLASIDALTFVPTPESGNPVSGAPGSNGLGMLHQGFLERSNVQELAASMELLAIERQRGSLISVGRRLGMIADRIPVPTATAIDATASRPATAPTEPPVALDPGSASVLAATLATNAALQRLHLANAANALVPGYKRREPTFATRTIDAGFGRSIRVQQLTGDRPDPAQGELERTDRSLDLAIDGEGWFCVHLPDGSTGYSRSGDFMIAADGKLVTAQGYVLLPEITLPSDTLEVHFDIDGTCVGRTAGSPDSATTLGRLAIARVDPAGLDRSAFDGAWTTTGEVRQGNPGDDGFGRLRNGYRERANVDATAELLALQALAAQREQLLATCRRIGFTVQ